MIKVHSFCFNPFQENTYVLYDETGDCVIIDPGCSNDSEREELKAFVLSNKLQVTRLLNTHCHIDHILGNAFVYEKYGLKPEAHTLEQGVLASGLRVAEMYGLNYKESPALQTFLKEGENVAFGNSELEVVFAPGHSPGHVVFVNKAQQFMIGGDVLFYGSIGRTDLPGGDFNTLIDSIKNKIFLYDNEMTVYPGHGPKTSIGYEKSNNPFLK